MSAVDLLEPTTRTSGPRWVGADSWPTSWGPAPRFSTERTLDRPTFGPAVGKIAERLGLKLFPSQQWVLDVALEVLPDGSWAFEEITDVEPRRSGKTTKNRPLVAHRCLMPGAVRSAWITAQKRDKAVARWRDLASPLSMTLGSEVKFTIGTGNEALRFLKTDGVFRPFAPNEEDMHGEDPDLVLVDEWWAFDLADKEAIEGGYKPAWSVKSGQAWLMSTAGTERSTWMADGVAAGRASVAAGRTSGHAHFEWSIPEVWGGVEVDKLGDEQLVRLVMDHHPRRDHGLRRAYLEEELRKDRARFLRAYGNIPQESVTETVIGRSTWRERAFVPSAADPKLIPDGVRFVLGLEVDELGRETAIVSGVRDAAGVARVEVVEVVAGTRWAASRVRELRERHSDLAVVGVNYAGPARDVADELERSGVPLLKLTATDYVAACSRIKSELTERPATLWHDQQRGPELTDAMEAAGERRLKAGPAWAPKGSEPITAWSAATVAVWAADHMPEPEPERAPFRIY